MITKDQIREDLRSGPCAQCGEMIALEENMIVTFHRGKFIILHTECAGFIDHAEKCPRGKRPALQSIHNILADVRTGELSHAMAVDLINQHLMGARLEERNSLKP
jgi:hypothetical protein